MRQKTTYFFYCFTLLLLIFSSAALNAQNIDLVVRGTIIDISNGQPIPGATIAEQDTDNRTVTGVISDFDGNFALRVKSPSNKLVISTLGYTSQTIPLTGKSSYVVKLSTSIDELEAVMRFT